MRIYNIQKDTSQIIGGVNNSSQEQRITVKSAAGDMCMYSAGSSDGHRGIWFYPHGTGTSGKAAIRTDTNNVITFSGDKFKGTPGPGNSWIKGRDDAIFKMESITSTKYNAMLSMKTTNGSWEMGEYDNGSNVNRLYFVYAKDSNYSSNTNTTGNAFLRPIDSGSYPISLASFSLSNSVLTITDPFAT